MSSGEHNKAALGYTVTVVVGTLKRIAEAVLYALGGAIVVLLIGFVLYLENRPDLKIWHTAELDEEFTTKSDVNSFEEYLALEDRLFDQLDELVYEGIEANDRRLINRFYRGSESDPQRWPSNWNRSFVFEADEPVAGVLLLHGLSDSPYSLRNLGQRLHGEGVYVIGLRLPGHGTAPVGLVSVTWEDMDAAVRLAMIHLREQAGDRPLYMVGYSNGAPLSIHYTLSALQDPDLPMTDRLVLISPAIGISELAVFAVWQERLGRLLGLRKLAWNAILPEYDPYKYQSFAVNAATLARRLTILVQNDLKNLSSDGGLERFPPVLAFQSVVDATVSTPAVIGDLFMRLPLGSSELVLFDLNRETEIEQILRHDPLETLRTMFADRERHFDLQLLMNENHHSRRVVIRCTRAGGELVREVATGLEWPDGIYSMSHVALPFPYDDPLYGADEDVESPGIQIGTMDLRGERGVLQIPAADMLRLRWNPFYRYLEGRVLGFLGVAEETEHRCLITD